MSGPVHPHRRQQAIQLCRSIGGAACWLRQRGQAQYAIPPLFQLHQANDLVSMFLQAWEVANKLGLIGPAMEQPQYNLFEREKVEKEYLPLYKRFGTGLTTWSPLASGVLSGKYAKGNVPEGSRLALEAYKVRRSVHHLQCSLQTCNPPCATVSGVAHAYLNS